jgi:pyrimidine-nucleoside phosphorylase
MASPGPAAAHPTPTRDGPAPPVPYRILERKRAGAALTPEEIRAVVTGSLHTWSDGQVGAFLMAAAIRGLDAAETRVLTEAMASSGEQWDIGAVLPSAIDKHSTGGVGDKVSILIAPLLAACGLPVAKLTARGLGHTGGTADKLESIPGIELEMDRERCLRLLERTAIAIGTASASIAPADRRLYGLRNLTATVDCLPLVASSVLAKKLALGTRSMVFDVKTGDGAFFARLEDSVALAELLVGTAMDLGRQAVAVVSDMSQPLGEWAGHACELREVVDCLRTGQGETRLLEVTCTLAAEGARLAGRELAPTRALEMLRNGEGWSRFVAWAAAQGADRAWLDHPTFEIAPVELVAEAKTSGVLAAVATRELGMLLLEAGGGRKTAGARIDPSISLRYRVRLGERVEAGQELARLYVQPGDEGLRAAFERCFLVEPEGQPPPIVHRVVRSRV